MYQVSLYNLLLFVSSLPEARKKKRVPRRALVFAGRNTLIENLFPYLNVWPVEADPIDEERASSSARRREEEPLRPRMPDQQAGDGRFGEDHVLGAQHVPEVRVQIAVLELDVVDVHMQSKAKKKQQWL